MCCIEKVLESLKRAVLKSLEEEELWTYGSGTQLDKFLRAKSVDLTWEQMAHGYSWTRDLDYLNVWPRVWSGGTFKVKNNRKINEEEKPRTYGSGIQLDKNLRVSSVDLTWEQMAQGYSWARDLDYLDVWPRIWSGGNIKSMNRKVKLSQYCLQARCDSVRITMV